MHYPHRMPTTLFSQISIVTSNPIVYFTFPPIFQLIQLKRPVRSHPTYLQSLQMWYSKTFHFNVSFFVCEIFCKLKNYFVRLSVEIRFKFVYSSEVDACTWRFVKYSKLLSRVPALRQLSESFVWQNWS